MDAQTLNSWDYQLKSVGRIAAILLLLFIISGSLFTIISPFFGWRGEVVISGSMEPAIQTGSVVIVHPIVPDTIQKGDIIMYYSPDRTSLITHRVVDVKSEPTLRFITRGDANNNSDINPVVPGQIVGIVAFTIPYLGLLTQFIKTPLGFTLFFLVPAVILIGREVLDLWREME
ncbi:MAG: signal peptidase I [Methanoregula sp.]